MDPCDLWVSDGLYRVLCSQPQCYLWKQHLWSRGARVEEAWVSWVGWQGAVSASLVVLAGRFTWERMVPRKDSLWARSTL